MTTFRGMEEQDYINSTDLAKIRIAKQIIADIIPQNSDVIGIREYQGVLEVLSSWETQYYKKIIIK